MTPLQCLAYIQGQLETIDKLQMLGPGVTDTTTGNHLKETLRKIIVVCQTAERNECGVVYALSYINGILGALESCGVFKTGYKSSSKELKEMVTNIMELLDDTINEYNPEDKF